jgi:hypothetical protein
MEAMLECEWYKLRIWQNDMTKLTVRASDNPLNVMIGASACLCGIRCRYDGKANTIPDTEDLYRAGKVVAICPEVLGGLPTPRIRCAIQGRD